MKQLIVLCLSCVALTFAQSDPPPELQHVLQVLRERVAALETSVPNFVCKERIISREYSDEKVKKETRAEAVLTTTRSTREGRGVFSEARADMAINGKASKRDHISGPFIWRGGPAYSDLHYLFNSDHGLECRTYQLAGLVSLESKQQLLLLSQAAAEQHAACRELPLDSSDKIWLDPKSFSVVRIESFNPPTTPIAGAVLTLIIDYAPVVFDGVTYDLPSHFISRLDFPGLSKHFQYEAFFSEYHKYGAESTIHIDSVQ